MGNAAFGDAISVNASGMQGFGTATGGEGGGLIVLAAPTVSINGNLHADGNDGGTTRGGGSGGGINIATTTLTVGSSVAITANGGLGQTMGPGGGGRVAITYVNGTMADLSSVVSLSGGAGGGGKQLSGGVGTLFVSKAGVRTLIVAGTVTDLTTLSPTPIDITNSTVDNVQLTNALIRSINAQTSNDITWFINGSLVMVGSTITAQQIEITTGAAISVDSRSVITTSGTVLTGASPGRNVTAGDATGTVAGGGSHAGIGGRGMRGASTAPGYGSSGAPATLGSQGGVGNAYVIATVLSVFLLNAIVCSTNATVAGGGGSIMVSRADLGSRSLT
jgi:hypothetical protein